MTVCRCLPEWPHGGVLYSMYLFCILCYQSNRTHTQIKMLCRNCKTEVDPRKIRAHLATCPAKPQNMMSLLHKFMQTMSTGKSFPFILCILLVQYEYLTSIFVCFTIFFFFRFLVSDAQTATVARGNEGKSAQKATSTEPSRKGAPEGTAI